MIDWELFKKLEREEEVDNVTTNVVGPYKLYKYTNDVHIKGRWNKWNREARGIIINTQTGEIVCRPMPKFFNLGERPESSLENLPDEAYIIYEKLDGSCGNAYMRDGSIYVATPGSMESEQAVFATSWLQEHLLARKQYADFARELEKCTPVFEILWPDNPGSNVVNYGEREELVLLAIRLHNGQEIMPHMVDAFAEKYGFSRPLEFDHDLTADIDQHIGENEEGYVIYFPMSQLRVKVKSDLYKMLHKMLDKLNPKGILELIEGREYRYLHNVLSECNKELAAQADDIAAALRRRFFELKYAAEDMYEQVICIEHRDKRTQRKKQAAYIQKESPSEVWGLVFAMLDNKFEDSLVWQAVKRGLK